MSIAKIFKKRFKTTRKIFSYIFQFFRKVGKRTEEISLNAHSAQLTLRILSALFPALLVLLTLLGYWLQPDQVVSDMVKLFSDIVPTEILDLISENIKNILSSRSFAVFSIGFALLVYTVSGLFRDLMHILNTVNGVKEGRSFIRKLLLSLLFLIVGVILTLLIVQLLFITADLVIFLYSTFGLEPRGLSLLFWRWPLILIVMFLFTYMSYVFIPDQPNHYWKWKIPGAVVFALVWLVTSLIFNWYVSSYADYNNTYGVLGTVILLLIYLQINTRLYLLGALLNAELMKRRLFFKK